MIILIILICLIVLGILLIDWRWEVLGVAILVIFGIYLIIHVGAWSTASYQYNQFVVQRDSFEQTLKNARHNDNPYEIAAITKDVGEWNQQLAGYKYDNKVFLLKDYVDDRIELLEPIK